MLLNEDHEHKLSVSGGRDFVAVVAETLWQLWQLWQRLCESCNFNFDDCSRRYLESLMLGRAETETV